MRRRHTLLVLAGLAVLLSACGVGTDGSPNLVAKKTVPPGLLQQTTPTTTPASPSQYVTLYFAGLQRLVAVSRPVLEPVSVRRAVQALAQGPTTAEATDGLESPISTAAPLRLSHLATSTVVVSVASTFTALTGREQTVAIAQLVYTLTAFPGVDGVRVTVSGRPVAVPTGNGTVGKGALDRQQFTSLAPI
ncbi:MAG: GerMN domain-containing protein [Acidimicrobiales bacterium]